MSEKFLRTLEMNFILFLNPRSELLSVLKQCLYNDPLAAEYLLLHLTSHIYGRQDVMAIGKFTLNITGCKIFAVFRVQPVSKFKS